LHTPAPQNLKKGKCTLQGQPSFSDKSEKFTRWGFAPRRQSGRLHTLNPLEFNATFASESSKSKPVCDGFPTVTQSVAAIPVIHKRFHVHNWRQALPCAV
jgi:hypothetical protein